MNKENKSQLKGIGGWLILPALGLVFTPIRMAIQFKRDILPALETETWNALTTLGTDAYHPMWAPVISFEVVSSIVMFVLSILLLVLFFRKSHFVPKLFIGWLLLFVAVQGVDLLLVNQIPFVASQADLISTHELFRSIVGAVIWVPYFLMSDRVKNTFIEEFPSRRTATPLRMPST